MGTFGTPSSYNNTGALGSATNPTTAQGLSRDRENQKAILELPGTQAWVEKTITDGVIVPTSAEIIVLPEGGASTDSLTTIVLTSDGTTTLHGGMLIRLKAANSNTITVVHGTGANNISTIDGNNVVLDTTWYLELKLINGLWVQQETNAYKTAKEAKASAATAQTLASGAYTLSGTSSTSSSVAAKVVNLSGYVLRTGSSVSVMFSNANTVASAITLNVNGTGAKSVYNQTGVISASNTALFAANQPIEFRYGGTGWVFFDAAKATTSFATSSTAAATADKVATCAGFALSSPARVFVSFSNANTVSGALTLNVNGTGAEAIYNELGAVSATNRATFPAGVPIEFIYDGIKWTYRKYQDEFAKLQGGSPYLPARAWVTYNAQGIQTIISSNGVSSITDAGGNGATIINFSQEMPDERFCVVGNAKYDVSGVDSRVPLVGQPRNSGTKTTTSVRVQTVSLGSEGTAYDCIEVDVVIFR